MPHQDLSCGTIIETRVVWLLLSVETEGNGDSRSTNDRGPSLVGSLGLSCSYKRLLFCLGWSNRPSKKEFFPHRTLFQFLCTVKPDEAEHYATLAWSR